MERPSLTPLTFHEFDRPTLNPWVAARWFLRRSLRWGWHGVKLLLWTLVVDLRRDKARQAVSLRQLALGLSFKVAVFVPVLVGMCMGLAYLAAHPSSPPSAEPARIFNVFSERVSLQTGDGLNLSAVWVPAVRPAEVLAREEDLLHTKYPAVVLVHNHGEDARQVLPLVNRLHAMGCHVLAVDLRGAGQSDSSPQTFGRRENKDVEAAIAYVASRTTSDDRRVIVWGVGTGGTAAVAANGVQPPLLVINELTPATMVDPKTPANRFVAEGPVGNLVEPLCRWTFDLLYGDGPATNQTGNALKVLNLTSTERDQAWEAIEHIASRQLLAPAS